MKAFLSLLRAQALVFLRDKIALFFTLVFPVVFILIFGFVWGGTEGPGVTLGLVQTGEDGGLLSAVLAQQKGLGVRRYGDRAELEGDLLRRRVDLGLVWDGKVLLFLQDPTRVQEGYALAEVARGIASAADLRRQGLAPVVEATRVNVGRELGGGWFELVVPGIMAFSVLISGLLAVSGRITQMKERGLLDRLLVTPMSPPALLGAIAGVRLGVGLVSTVITLGIAVALFGVEFQVNWPLYLLFVVATTVGAMGLGTLIALLVRRPGSASTVASIVAQVMLFLSGVYFPVEIMPAFLRDLARAFPLTYMVEGMRYVTGVADLAPGQFALVTAGFLLLGVGLFPVLGRYVVRPGRR